MNRPLLSIIIVKYRSDEYLPRCLASIGQDARWQVIVVDNDRENVGFAAGCNLGAARAKGRYLLFLNPDTELQESALTEMVGYLEGRPEVTVLGPRLLEADQRTVQLSCCRFPGVLTALFVYSRFKKIWPHSLIWQSFAYAKQVQTAQPLEVDVVSGAALMVRRRAFESVGGFDPQFFLYFEENDLCRRIKRAGGRVVYFPRAQIVHWGGKSTASGPKNRDYFQESRSRFFQKHYPCFWAKLLNALTAV